MDAVPKNRRGFWKSLESISSFGWSGSAFIGGMISKKGDYYNTFIATSLISFCALPIYIYLSTFVPRFEKQSKQGEDNMKVHLVSSKKASFADL